MLRSVLCTAFVVLASAAIAAPAPGRVELQVYSEERVPITAQQEWAQQLGTVGVGNVQFRTKQGSDQVGVDVRGTETSRIYIVTGALNSQGELVLPNGRFRPGQAAAVARWLKDLAIRGLGENAPEREAFGLTATQFNQAKEELAIKVGFPTRGKPRAEVAQKIAGLLPARVHWTEDAAALGDDAVAEELQTLTVGTALACVLRPAGYCLVPFEATGGRVEYAVRSAKKTAEPWPIGWPPEKPAPSVLPGLYETFNANVQNVPVTRVLAAVEERLKTPLLMDHNAMARHGVDPEKAPANAPQSRTTYNNLLRKVLSQSKLKYELRVDEAGTPLLWVTTQQPL